MATPENFILVMQLQICLFGLMVRRNRFLYIGQETICALKWFEEVFRMNFLYKGEYKKAAVAVFLLLSQYTFNNIPSLIKSSVVFIFFDNSSSMRIVKSFCGSILVFLNIFIYFLCAAFAFGITIS